VLAPDGSGVEVHEDLRPLSWLIGRWVGVGTGQYPTIEDFRFGQEVVFSTDGRPFLTYLSRSWMLDDEGNRVRPLATEAGFWRPRPGNEIEMTLTHPTGFAEVWYGSQEVTAIVDATITGARADLTTDSVMRTASAKEYTLGHRLYGLVEGRLLWTFDMAAVGQPLLNHLAASLTRDDPTADPADGQEDAA
jgi:THAP4-like, heme-binding beta-barrel domain